MAVAEVMSVMRVGGCVRRVVGQARRLLSTITAITALTVISTATVFAAEPSRPFAAPEAAERVATPGAGSLAQVTLSLVLVLAAVFAAAWLVRRLKTLGKFGSGPIEVLADVSVGAKERAVLVQVGGKQLLLGVAPGRVTTLHVLEQPISVEQLKAKTPAVQMDVSGAPQRPDFKSILKRSLGL